MTNSSLTSEQLTLNQLDLQGYCLVERLRGIALLLDPSQADIVRYAAQLLADVDSQVRGLNADESKSYLLLTVQRVQKLTNHAVDAHPELSRG